MNVPLKVIDVVGTGNKVISEIASESQSKITASEEIITPDQAQIYLDNQEANRHINLTYVRRLLEDMQQGRWVAKGDPIKFTSSGKLVDGQHRLTAVVMSGNPQTFVVLRGYAQESMQALDIGKSRSSSHVGQIIGLDINAKHTATINCLSLPYKDVTRSTPQILEIFEKYEDGIRFACRTYPGTTLQPVSPMKALVAKAYYYENTQRLQEFMQVFCTGFAIEGHNQNDDLAAIALNQNRANSRGHMGWGERSTWYLKCQTALGHFLRRQPTKFIAQPRSVMDLYPLPDIQTGSEFEKRLRMFNYTKAKCK